MIYPENYDAFGLSPKQGFTFKRVLSIWVMVTLIPMLLTASVGAAVVAGMMWSWQIQLIAAILAFVAIWWAVAVWAWFQLRGWGRVIQVIEEMRREGRGDEGRAIIKQLRNTLNGGRKSPRSGRRERTP